MPEKQPHSDDPAAGVPTGAYAIEKSVRALTGRAEWLHLKSASIGNGSGRTQRVRLMA